MGAGIIITPYSINFLPGLAPIIYKCGFIEAPLTILNDVVEPWYRSINLRVSMKRLALPLREALPLLAPLSAIESTQLWVETHSPWLACFTNALRGGSGPIAHLARIGRTRSLKTSYTPQTLPSRPTKGSKGTWGSTKFIMYGPDKMQWLNVIRGVEVVNDGGRWVFQTSGQ